MMMQIIKAVAGIAVIIVWIALTAAWVVAVVNFDPDDPNQGCQPGQDCDMCPFPPCERKRNQKGE